MSSCVDRRFGRDRDVGTSRGGCECLDKYRRGTWVGQGSYRTSGMRREICEPKQSAGTQHLLHM